MKAIWYKAISKKKLNGEKLKAIPLNSGIRQHCPFSPYLFYTVLDGLARPIGKLKEVKWIQTRNEEVKVLLFTDDMIPYISSP